MKVTYCDVCGEVIATADARAESFAVSIGSRDAVASFVDVCQPCGSASDELAKLIKIAVDDWCKSRKSKQ